jgi:hypothetical protein
VGGWWVGLRAKSDLTELDRPRRAQKYAKDAKEEKKKKKKEKKEKNKLEIRNQKTKN